jgi:dUTP pyrophosphatase
MKIQIVGDLAQLPKYALVGDAGMDLRASETVLIGPGERALVPTGIKLALPEDVVALVHPRSGLALKHGVTVLNAPGTIDSNYRGEIGVILHNTSSEWFDVDRGDRIAQLVFQKVLIVELEHVDELSDSVRGSGGFGSTGAK